MDDNQIKVLVVDDSKVSRDLMKHLLQLDSQIKIIGDAENGIEALKFFKTNVPDLVITDIVMPKMNGFELTKKIMETHPVPIIVVSGVYNKEEIQNSFHAIDAGALAILEKPKGLGDAQFAETTKFIVDTVKAISKIRYISQKKATAAQGEKQFTLLDSCIKEKLIDAPPIHAVAIGSSLGGPKALQQLLMELPADIKAPLFIVQHISPGFVHGFVDWLKKSSKLKISIAKNGEHAKAGYIYIAPDKAHLEIMPGGIISLVEDKLGFYVPSIGKLFKSMANAYRSNCAGILLLGGEKDGHKDFQYILEKGGLGLLEVNPYIPDSERPKDASKTLIPATVEELAVGLKYLLGR